MTKSQRSLGPLPSEKEVREALAKLIVLGPDAVWSPEVQPLLQLPAVREKAAELGGERLAEALKAVLQTAVDDLGESQYRVLLTIVLGLDPQYEFLSAGEKRAVAGERFRGGARKVGAGTIRQHHEPRALDELASRLMAPRAGAPASENLEFFPAAEVRWHPDLHRRYGERLVFIRISFSRYRRRDALDALHVAMEANQVRSWSVHELYGLFDVLVRAWVPVPSTEYNLSSALARALSPRAQLIEVFSVERTVLDSTAVTDPVGIDPPPPEEPARELSPAEIASVDNGVASEAELSELVAMGALIRGAPETGGVGFFVMVAMLGHTLVLPQGRASFEQAILDIAERGQPLLSDLEVYAGSGFTAFLIKGTLHSTDIGDLHRLLLDPLAEADAVESMWTSTFISSAPWPIFSVESLPVETGASSQPEARELLQQEEGPTFEVKGSALTDLRRWLVTNERPAEAPNRKVTESLLSAITAFLNSNGGTILVGAVEKEAFEGVADPDHPLLRGAPGVGPYLVTGIDHELPEGWDKFAREVYAQCKRTIHPEPSPYLEIEFEKVDDRTVSLIKVRAPEGNGMRQWFYLGREGRELSFVVRQGAMTVALVGPAADEYKRAHV